jgi:hypothetical protein
MLGLKEKERSIGPAEPEDAKAQVAKKPRAPTRLPTAAAIAAKLQPAGMPSMVGNRNKTEPQQKRPIASEGPQTGRKPKVLKVDIVPKVLEEAGTWTKVVSRNKAKAKGRKALLEVTDGLKA